MVTRTELASFLRDFLTGGDGYMLDCFLQEPEYDVSVASVADGLFEINRKYTSSFYPIGLSNPDAKAELWDVVHDLEGETPE